MKQPYLQPTTFYFTRVIRATQILPVLIMFSLFFGLATARAGNNAVLPGTSISFLSPNSGGCVANFIDSVSDLEAYFTSTSTDTDANTVYRWYFGDGGVSHEKNPKHRYESANSYTVCLTIINSSLNCRDSVCHTITLTQCQASFDTIVIGNTLTVKSTSTGVDANTSYHWDFGDGGIGQQDSQSHTYTPSTYICSLPVGLSNNQSTSTPQGFQQMVVVNSTMYSSHENSGLNNIEFTTGPNATGTVLQAWLESGDSSTSSNTIYWVNLGSDTILANSSITIYMDFMPSAVMSALGPIGEAPQLSTPYGQYDNGSIVFPNCYTAWGGLSGGVLPSTISSVGDVGVTNYPAFTQIYFEDYYSTDGVYFTSMPASVTNFPGVLESYCNNTGYYSWFGTGNGFEEGGTGVTIDYDYPGFSATDFGIKSNGGNEAYITNQALTDSPLVWSLLLADQNTLTSVLSNYTNVLSGPNYVEAESPQYYGYFGTQQNGGSTYMNVYWTRTRTYPPGGTMPTASLGSLTCQAQGATHTVCLTITNSVTGCISETCETAIVNPFVSSCTAAFNSSTSDLKAYFTSTSTDTDANTTYKWNFGDGGVSQVINPIHQYATGGTYTTCLTIFNKATGCSDSVCHTITITQCQANFTADVNDNQVTVTSTSTGTDNNTSYLWTFGDGGTGNLPSQSHTYALTTTICSVPVTISNSQSVATTTGFQQMVIVNSSLYSTNENAGLNNIEFTTGPQGEGTPLQAWIESGDSSVSTNTVYWVNLGNTIIPANDSLTIYMDFMPSSVLSTAGPTGEAPQLSATYGQYDNGSLVFPGAYTAWGGLSGGVLPSGISSTGDVQVINNSTSSQVTFLDGCCNADGVYYTNTPSSASTYPTVLESYNDMQGDYMWFGTGNGSEEGGNGVTIDYDYPGFSATNFGIKSDQGGNNSYAYITNALLTNNPVIWSISFQDSLDLNAILENYTNELGPQQIEANSPQYYGYFGTQQNGGNNYMDIYWTRTRTYPPAGVMPTTSAGSVSCANRGVYTICLNISNSATGCSSSTCQTVVVGPVTCQASFDTSVNGNTITVTSTSSGVDANTEYRWTFGDGSTGTEATQSHTYIPNKVCSVPVILTNNQSVATPANFQQMITVNSSTYASNELTGLQNIEFTTGDNNTGIPLQAWIESGNSSSSTNTVYWINMGSSIIPANGSLTIYMNFESANILSSTGPTGEAPQLSGTYAQYDNGSLVFPNFYDNFAGTSLASQWTSTGAATVTVNNGLTLGYNGPNWYGIYTNTFSSALNTIAESYCAASSVNGNGLCINTSGTNGNGINTGTDGADAQLDNQYMFGGNGSCTSAPGTNAQAANASPAANTYYLFSFEMLSTPVLQMNYGAFTTLTDLGQSGSAGTISANSEVGLGVSGATGSFQWFRDRTYPPNGVMPTASFNAVSCKYFNTAYTVCLTIANTVTDCISTTCETVVTTPFVSSCTASFIDSTSSLRSYFTSTSTDTDANTSYKWSFGDGGISEVKNPTHLYENAGTYTACLSIFNSSTGCNDSVCHTITINQCQASFDTVVNGNTITVTSTSTGVDANTAYHWDFGDGTTGQDASQSHTYKSTGPECFIPVTITNGQDSATPTNFQEMITVNSSTYSSNESSGLQNVEFSTGPGGTGNVLQAWIESGASSAATSTVYWVNLGSATIPANGSLNIYMDFMSTNIMSATGPTGEAPQLSSTYGQFDNGIFVFPNFYDNFAGTALASKWTNTGGATATVNNGLALAYSGKNWYGIYTNTFSSALNTIAESYCKASSVNGDGLCINTSGTNGNGINTGTDGVDAQLDNQYMFGGDGSCTSAPGTNAQTANASPTANTFYIFSLEMLSTPVLQMNYGVFTTLSDLGQSGSAGTISPTSEVGLGVSGNGVTSTFQWFRDRAYPPNGVMPTASLNSLTCTSNGAYTVCLTISNTGTGCSSTTCEVVTLTPAAASTCTASFIDSTSSLEGYFTSTSTDTDANTNYKWSFGDGGISQVKNPMHQYDTAGTYTVCLSIFNSGTGCNDSVCHTVVITQCQASFTTAVNGGQITVKSTSTGVDANTTYHWDFGDGGIGQLDSQSHSYDASGKYQVCLTISNTATGCISSSCDSVSVVVPPLCMAKFTISSDGLKITVKSTSTGVDSNTLYHWTFGDDSIGKLDSLSHTYATPGTYFVCLTIDDTVTGCTSSRCDSITVKYPTDCFADFKIVRDSLKLTVISTSTGVNDSTSYHWTFGDDGTGQLDSQSHTYAMQGTYFVCLTISNPDGCTSTRCDSVTMKYKASGIEQLSFSGSSLYYDNNASQIVLKWANNDNVNISLVDILGRNEQQIYVGNLTTGTYRYNVNSSEVAAGIYFVRILANDGSHAWKILILPH